MEGDDTRTFGRDDAAIRPGDAGAETGWSAVDQEETEDSRDHNCSAYYDLNELTNLSFGGGAAFAENAEDGTGASASFLKSETQSPDDEMVPADTVWLMSLASGVKGGTEAQEIARAMAMALASSGGEPEALQIVLYDIVGDFETVLQIMNRRDALLQNIAQILDDLQNSGMEKDSSVDAKHVSKPRRSGHEERSMFRIQDSRQTKTEKNLRKDERRAQRQKAQYRVQAGDDVRARKVFAPPSASCFTKEDAGITSMQKLENIVEHLKMTPSSRGEIDGGGTSSLPKGTERKVMKGYEEVLVPAAVSKAVDLEKRTGLVEVEQEMDVLSQQAMGGIKKLNVIQSAVFEAAFKTNENLLVCAPTGAGKTNVALLTVLHEIMNHADPKTNKIDLGAFKIVYVAPMKALAAEVVQKFGERLSCLGVTVKELTGDVQLTRTEAEQTQVVVVTPEKWDVITRKAVVGNGNPVTEKLRLLIIDEVHLLHDDRGAVIESVVARTLRTVESQQTMIRLVGLSATLPNYKDVAKFLRVNPDRGLFHFDASFRPVPLSQSFIGVSEKDRKKRAILSINLCYEKVSTSMRDGNQVMVFVHTRKGTAKTARELLEISQEDEEAVPLFVPGQSLPGNANPQEPRKKFYEIEESIAPPIPDWALKEIAKFKSADLRELCLRGLAVHHAGLLRPDRKLVEKLFTEGVVRCLVCTSTLAWGVNLPAHTVVIHGTEIYDSKRGGFVELGMLDVMQIFGRAGRPQFDSEGEGVIITTHSKLSHYLQLLTSSLPIESRMVQGSSLVDHLNAEIVLGSVSNTKEGVEWLGYTYLAVRMTQNPLVYGLDWSQLGSDPGLRQHKEKMISLAARDLDEARMVRYDPSTGSLGPTDLGRVASHFYVSLGTILHWKEALKPDTDEPSLLRAVAMASEFEELQVREDEINDLMSLRKLACPFKVLGGLDNVPSKVNILLQAYISKASLKNFTLISDTHFVQQNASRLMQAVFEIALKQGWAFVAGIALDFCKALDRQVWQFQHPLRQLPKIVQPEVAARLENEKTGGLEDLREMTHAEITSLTRSPRVATNVMNAVSYLPCFKIDARISPLTRTVMRLDVELTQDFQWNGVVHGSSAKASERWFLWVEDCDQDRIYHSEKISVNRKQMKETMKLVILVPVFDPPASHYGVRLSSTSWHGGDSYASLSLSGLTLPDKQPPHTELLPLRPMPKESLMDPLAESMYKFTHFNPVQTQVFHVLHHQRENVLVGAPTGSGKTVMAELAMLRAFRETPNSVVVYIGPLKALVRERVLDWRNRVVKLLNKKLVELTGDNSPSGQAIESADLICTTPEKWDGISRDWKQRDYVRRVSLIILDEVHLLGGDRGHVLETIVSRTRRTNRDCRLVALSTALANAGELANWLAADPKSGCFNFKPSVRPVPCEAHIIGVPGEHYCPRMSAMNRPAYTSIIRYSPRKPVLIFVSSRRQTRLTAFEIIRLAAAEGDPRKFAHGSPEEHEDAQVRIKDPAFRQAVEFGIGIHHAGMPDADRALAEHLFLTGKIQVLVSTSTLAWGVNLPAHLVIVKGTEFYDSAQGKYVDMPITDILQMMGRAGRPQFDDRAFAVILVQDSKKSFYKKFLYDPFPVESYLRDKLHDHMNAEIAGGTIKTAQDAVDYLTWTYFFRRVITNPSYYGVDDQSPAGISIYFSKLIGEILGDLADSNCIEINGEDLTILEKGHAESARTLEPLTKESAKEVVGALSKESQKELSVKATFLGLTSSNYYVSHKTVKMFSGRVKSSVDPEGLLRILTDASEYAEVPVRHNEDENNKELAESIVKTIRGMSFAQKKTVDEVKKQFAIFDDQMDSPHMKARLLLLAHIMRVPFIVPDYKTDARSALDNAGRLMQALLDISLEYGYLDTSKNCILLIEMLHQGIWHVGVSTLIGTGLPQDVQSKLKKMRITSMASFAGASVRTLGQMGSGNSQLKHLLQKTSARLPRLEISRCNAELTSHEEDPDSFWGSTKPKIWHVTVTLTCKNSSPGQQGNGVHSTNAISSAPLTKPGTNAGWFLVACIPDQNLVLSATRVPAFATATHRRLRISNNGLVWNEARSIPLQVLAGSQEGFSEDELFRTGMDRAVATPESERRCGPKSKQSSERKWRELFLSRSAARIQKARAEAVRLARQRGAESDLVKRLDLEGELRNSAESTEERKLLEDGIEVDELVRELWECVQAMSEEEEAQIIASQNADMTAAIASLESLRVDGSESDSACLCPCCREDYLMMNRGTVFCRCGLRIPTRPSDGVSLAIVRQRLSAVYEHHGYSGCNKHLVFKSKEIFSLTALVAECVACGLSEIVL